MRNGCCVVSFIYSEISVVWCFVFICCFIPFFLPSRHMNKYFSNLAVYYAWVSQLVSYLLPVERWIFVNPWLPARSCLQLMSSLVVFSFWCVLVGDSIFIFKTTFLSSTVSQGIISLSLSPSPQHDCFKYFFHDSSLPKLFSKYKNITFKYSLNCYSKPAKCSMSPFLSFSDCFSSFYSLLGRSCAGCLKSVFSWPAAIFVLWPWEDSVAVCANKEALDQLQSDLWDLAFEQLRAGNHQVQAYGRNVSGM